jgi:hypothetical protein
VKSALYLVTAVLLAAAPLHAFQRETTNDDDCTEAPGVNCGHKGTPLAWKVAPVTFAVNSDASGLAFADVSAAVRSAFSTWQSASSDKITFSFGGQSHAGTDGNDGQNTVHFVHLGSHAADTFAQSILTYDSRTGEIFDVDIELNADEPFAILPDGEMDPFDPQVDVRAVATHEVGHLLGLAHENRFGSTVVMFFSDTSGNTTHRSLTSDDRSGVRAIYPTTVGLTNSGSGGGGSGGGGGGGCRLDPEATPFASWPVVALLAPLAFLRKRGQTPFRTRRGV